MSRRARRLNFVIKSENIRYCGNMGGSDADLADTSPTPKREDPRSGVNIWGLAPISELS